MDPITIAIALATQFAPAILKHLTGSDKVAEVAERVIDAAKGATGAPTGELALEELRVNPEAVLDFRRAVLAQEVALETLAQANAAAVNETMQTEAASEHWPSYSWRPAIGFAVAFNVAITSVVVGLAFAAVILLSRDAAPLAHIPAMIAAMAALIGVVAPILGIASWFRGKAQADPAIPPARQLPFRTKE